ncbi:MAG TPA: ABC transporter permease subunit, partial [Gaiellaceae bacterium]|nr:ABC transporter permease subunit [Gaiellaceae bacterium]
MSATTTAVTRRPPPWRDVRVLRLALQALFLLGVVSLVLFLLDNLVFNLRRLGIETGFGFLDQPAGFAIPDSDFRSSQDIQAAILQGARTTVVVALAGIVLATLLGVVVGVARLSTNWLVRRTAALYVETFRNVPVLVIIVFLYLAVFLRLPPISRAVEWVDVLVLSNRGLVVPWLRGTGSTGSFLLAALVVLALAAGVWVWRTRRFDRTGEKHRRVLWAGATLLAGLAVAFVATGRPYGLSLPERGDLGVANGFRVGPEFAALLFGLVLYTASHIAEIVRGSIQAVARGQTEAANALGLSEFQRLRLVVLPQAFRIAIPPLANQFLNLTKNSSLGIAVSVYEVTKVTRVSISQGAPAPQAIAILMLVYLVFSLTIAFFTNLANRR